AAVGVEAVADNPFAVTFYVGDDRDQARRHLAEIDVGVADRRRDRLGDFGDVHDSNGHDVSYVRLRWAALKRSAAADGDFLAGDRSSVLRQQVGYEGRDLARPDPPPERRRFRWHDHAIRIDQHGRFSR